MSSKKRSSLAMSDSDDSDGDDDLLESVFGGSRASKRKIAKDEAAEKEKRMAQMNALLNIGKVKLERENRMDELCQENKILMKDDDFDCLEKDKKCKSGTRENEGTTTKSGVVSSSAQQYEPKDSKATSCLGARITLQFARDITLQRSADEMLPRGENKKESCSFAPFWSGCEEALTDLRTILVADQQKQKGPSSSAKLREELLRLCTTNSPHACRTYLKKTLLYKKKDPDQVRRIHVNVLRWLMALACGPVTNGDRKEDGGNDPIKAKSEQSTKEATQSMSPISSQRFLVESQAGAYQTLYRLWSHDLGFPLQEQGRGEIYLLSIRALPRQLRQWFGSSFSFEITSDDNDESGNEDKNKTVHVINSHITLVRFLELWALALQKENDNDDTKEKVNLIRFYCDENGAGFRKDISEAIMAVLWAGLNFSFASSISAKNDGSKAIQTIVSCLVDRVRRCIRCDKNSSAESFEEWMKSLCERIVTTWSTQLGRGRIGTDAYEDKEAWMSLARTVTRLFRIDGDDYKFGERSSASSLKDFRLSLCRYILIRAFVSEQDGQEAQDAGNGSNEKRTSSDGKSYDWVSPLIDAEIHRMQVPVRVRSSHRWKAMALAVAGLVKLAYSFPEDEASKCFALIDICTGCFQSAIVELEPEIRKNLRNEKKNFFDDEEDIVTTKDMASSIVTDEVLEKHALYNTLVRLESASDIISNRIRPLIMRNICFPWAGNMAESLRNYVCSQKDQYAPPKKGVTMKQQSTINSFFKNDTVSRELTTH